MEKENTVDNEVTTGDIIKREELNRWVEELKRKKEEQKRFIDEIRRRVEEDVQKRGKK